MTWWRRAVRLSDGQRRQAICAQLDALPPALVDGQPHRPRLVWRYPVRDRRKLWLVRSQRGAHAVAGRFGS